MFAQNLGIPRPPFPQYLGISSSGSWGCSRGSCLTRGARAKLALLPPVASRGRRGSRGCSISASSRCNSGGSNSGNSWCRRRDSRGSTSPPICATLLVVRFLTFSLQLHRNSCLGRGGDPSGRPVLQGHLVQAFLARRIVSFAVDLCSCDDRTAVRVAGKQVQMSCFSISCFFRPGPIIACTVLLVPATASAPAPTAAPSRRAAL
mmetsp:Transcript_3517/g.8002  ORF Transcript_3517/g.8002 Transcript_3517/m.8002 type:complete len:205 (+) Transcript_3517:136-750(+)